MGTISFSQFAQSRRASIVAIEMEGKKRSVAGSFIPETILITGHYAAAKTGVTVGEVVQLTTADEFGSRYGFGTMIHRQAIKVFAALGGFSSNVYACPIAAAVGGTAGTATLTFVGAATTAGTMYFSIAGDLYALTVTVGMTAIQQAAALVALLTTDINSAVTAAVGGTGSDHIVTLTSKDLSASAAEIRVVYNPAGTPQSNLNPSGTAVTISSEYLASGAGVPVVSTVFTTSGGTDNLGDKWFTFITCPFTDSTTLAAYKAASVARADPTVKRPFGYVVGYVNKTYAQALALPATINAKFCAPVWEDRVLAPSYELAAAITGTAAYSATIDPGRAMKNVEVALTTKPGVNRSYNENDALFKAGIGFMFVQPSGALYTGDLALSYRTTPTGGATEEWFDLESLTLKQEKVYSIDQLFLNEPYVRPIAGSDDLVTGKSYVIAPKQVIADLRNLVDFWASQGWTKNPDTVKATITAEINALNNSRIDAEMTDDPAQVLRIIAIKYGYLY